MEHSAIMIGFDGVYLDDLAALQLTENQIANLIEQFEEADKPTIKRRIRVICARCNHVSDWFQPGENSFRCKCNAKRSRRTKDKPGRAFCTLASQLEDVAWELDEHPGQGVLDIFIDDSVGDNFFGVSGICSDANEVLAWIIRLSVFSSAHIRMFASDSKTVDRIQREVMAPFCRGEAFLVAGLPSLTDSLTRSFQRWQLWRGSVRSMFVNEAAAILPNLSLAFTGFDYDASKAFAPLTRFIDAMKNGRSCCPMLDLIGVVPITEFPEYLVASSCEALKLELSGPKSCYGSHGIFNVLASSKSVHIFALAYDRQKDVGLQFFDRSEQRKRQFQLDWYKQLATALRKTNAEATPDLYAQLATSDLCNHACYRQRLFLAVYAWAVDVENASARCCFLQESAAFDREAVIAARLDCAEEAYTRFALAKEASGADPVIAATSAIESAAERFLHFTSVDHLHCDLENFNADVLKSFKEENGSCDAQTENVLVSAALEHYTTELYALAEQFSLQSASASACADGQQDLPVVAATKLTPKSSYLGTAEYVSMISMDWSKKYNDFMANRNSSSKVAVDAILAACRDKVVLSQERPLSLDAKAAPSNWQPQKIPEDLRNCDDGDAAAQCVDGPMQLFSASFSETFAHVSNSVGGKRSYCEAWMQQLPRSVSLQPSPVPPTTTTTSAKATRRRIVSASPASLAGSVELILPSEQEFTRDSQHVRTSFGEEFAADGIAAAASPQNDAIAADGHRASSLGANDRRARLSSASSRRSDSSSVSAKSVCFPARNPRTVLPQSLSLLLINKSTRLGDAKPASVGSVAASSTDCSSPMERSEGQPALAPKVRSDAANGLQLSSFETRRTVANTGGRMRAASAASDSATTPRDPRKSASWINQRCRSVQECLVSSAGQIQHQQTPKNVKCGGLFSRRNVDSVSGQFTPRSHVRLQNSKKLDVIEVELLKLGVQRNDSLFLKCFERLKSTCEAMLSKTIEQIHELSTLQSITAQTAAVIVQVVKDEERKLAQQQNTSFEEET